VRRAKESEKGKIESRKFKVGLRPAGEGEVGKGERGREKGKGERGRERE
jgi:hypothetical protein